MTNSEIAYLEHLRSKRFFYSTRYPKIGQGEAGNNANLPNTCPACGYPSIQERTSWKLCPICWWEDDGQDEEHADEVWGGPNGDWSLTGYRIAFYHRFNNIKTSSTANEELVALCNELEHEEQALLDNNSDINAIKAIISYFDSLPVDITSILNPDKDDQ